MTERTHQQDRLDIQFYRDKTYKAGDYKDLLDKVEKMLNSFTTPMK